MYAPCLRFDDWEYREPCAVLLIRRFFAWRDEFHAAFGINS